MNRQTRRSNTRETEGNTWVAPRPLRYSQPLTRRNTRLPSVVAGETVKFKNALVETADGPVRLVRLPRQ
jgi:hypothetical protein